jgi:phospholipid/cholesterol/gamma-HCH transport system permease protein
MDCEAPRISRSGTAEAAQLVLEGDWTAEHSRGLAGLSHNVPRDVRSLTIDLEMIGRLDTFGAWAIDVMQRSAKASGATTRLLLPKDARAELVEKLRSLSQASGGEKPRRRWSDGFDVLGRMAETFFIDIAAFFDLVGRMTFALIASVRNPVLLRARSIVHHIDRTGVRAIPIIMLMTFLIGCIIAQQGFFHFQRFGATDYVVDLVTILVLREIGVLLVTIMVAGRSGSSYTAELGSMKMREEVDALRTMGLDPADYLILPRVLALIVALPLLTIVGNLSALYGAGLVAWLYADMSPGIFIERLHAASSYVDFEVGLIKAPVMALVIGGVAALEGMKVRGSAESLGQRTTSSVVRSIFFVIVLDGVFAVLFAFVGM